jgi:hypothetical protein
MQPSLDRPKQSTHRLRSRQPGKGRWLVNEYPAGYVAQLARGHAGKLQRRGAPVDGQDRAVDVGGSIAREKEHGLGDLVGGP